MEVVFATLEHVQALASRLREADVAEIRAASGDNPERALTESLMYSPRSWTWLCDGEPIAMFGVAQDPSNPTVGVPWLLGAPEIAQHKMFFLRTCKHYIDQMLDACPVLTNWVDCRNTVSIQWLAWCGFALCEVNPFFGVQRLPFIRFCKARAL